MNEKFSDHKLTAIFYADVANYSRLISQNEESGHKRVMQVLDFASESISAGKGTVLRYAGDAILAELSTLGTLGRKEEAREALMRAISLQPNLSISFIKQALPITHEPSSSHFYNSLIKAGVPEEY